MKKPSHAFKHEIEDDDELEDVSSDMDTAGAGDAQRASARKKSFARWSWSVSLVLIGLSAAIIGYTGYLVWSIE